jgi:hypothetical protein
MKKSRFSEPKPTIPLYLVIVLGITFVIIIIILIFLLKDELLVIVSSLFAGGMLIFLIGAYFSQERSRYIISGKSIKIKIPERISFKILWINIETIEVVKKKDLNPITDKMGDVYNFIFKNIEFSDNYRIWVDVEFSEKNLMKINSKLDELTTLKQKLYIFKDKTN